ncbi:hemerythrin domain-containing protein [Candidatus Woesearchaeota archaeon]|nr:hemerythrin domain-containing protein [Candidatus Woesearchaeota archaeon]
MNNVLEFMGKDHDRLDGVFKDFRSAMNSDISKAKQLFHDFKTGLQKHIVWEEEILFPLFENKTRMFDEGPTAIMRMEHRQIKDFLEKIHKRISEKDCDVELLQAGLIEVLTEHNNKEESILYPWIDKETSELEREEAFAKMKNLSPEKYCKCCGE